MRTKLTEKSDLESEEIQQLLNDSLLFKVNFKAKV